jgi:hypothetical protein
MIQKKSTFFLGFFIFLIPFLGFPGFWKTVFTIISGLSLVALSVKFSVPKKTIRPKQRKDKVVPFAPENIVVENSVPPELKPEPEVPVSVPRPPQHGGRRKKEEKAEVRQ